MMAFGILKQTAAVARINLLSIPRRLPTSTSVVVSIALVVMILLGSLSLERGLSRVLEKSGADDVAIALRAGSENEINSYVTAEQQQLLEEAPGVVRIRGAAAVSPEAVLVMNAIKRASGAEANLTLRGVAPTASAARPPLRFVSGRMFRPGTNELIVGRDVADAFRGFEIDAEQRIGENVWRIVGIFEAGGSVIESEVWADLPIVQTLFDRGSAVQSVRLRLMSPTSIAKLREFNASDSRLKLDIRSERAFFRAQSEGIADLILRIGKPLALIMAIGAFAGAVNAMYASVADRSVEIATLRTIGFGSGATFLGTMLESAALALLGAVIGTVAALLLFNGLTASTLGGAFTQIVFDLSFSPGIILQGVGWSLALGLLGGAVPAWKAARQPILAAVE